jgi:hypothetical protein
VLKVVDSHATLSQRALNLTAQMIRANSAGDNDLPSLSAQQLVRMASHIQSRATQRLPDRQQIPQSFAQPDDGQLICHHDMIAKLAGFVRPPCFSEMM